MKGSFEYIVMTFRNKQDYVDEFAGVHNLHIVYFKDSFNLFSIAIILVTALFFAHHLVKAIKRSIHLVTSLSVHRF